MSNRSPADRTAANGGNKLGVAEWVGFALIVIGLAGVLLFLLHLFDRIIICDGEPRLQTRFFGSFFFDELTLSCTSI